MTHEPESATGGVLMTPGEVAAVFEVSPKTVARWSRSGRLAGLRTLGKRRRCREAEVQALRDDEGSE